MLNDHSCNGCLPLLTAEKDKEFFEEKLSTSSIALDDLNQQMHDLSLKLESAEETLGIRECSHPKYISCKIYSVSKMIIIRVS